MTLGGDVGFTKVKMMTIVYGRRRGRAKSIIFLVLLLVVESREG